MHPTTMSHHFRSRLPSLTRSRCKNLQSFHKSSTFSCPSSHFSRIDFIFRNSFFLHSRLHFHTSVSAAYAKKSRDSNTGSGGLSASSFTNLHEFLTRLAKKENVDALREEFKQLNEQMLSPDFAQVRDKGPFMIRYSKVESTLHYYNNAFTELQNLQDLYEMALEEKEKDTLRDIQRQLTQMEEELEEKEFASFMSGEMDEKDVFIEINAGAGGTESCDWVAMLKNMYERWAGEMGFRVHVEQETKGQQAGFRNVTLKVQGQYAFGWMRSESGVHRLVRVSPFDSNARRHTSFAEVFVFPVVDESIKIDIDPKDLIIETMRASGPGGQAVNTTDSAVRITHIPTGISVKNRNERDQNQNKLAAMRILTAKLYQLEEQKRREQKMAEGQERPEASFGSQIRSYVLHPYKLVKDSRTGHQSHNPDAVLSGEELEDFMRASLKHGL